MKREIGSNFWIEAGQEYPDADIDLAEFGIRAVSDMVLTSTGRSAESIIVSRILKDIPHSERIALVPPFTCHTVIDPLWLQGFKLYTYSIDRFLNTTPEMLRTALNVTGARIVLLHRYFGFDTLQGCADVIEEFTGHGVTFIEDHTQSMYSSHKALPVLYHFGSFRKWLGVLDGGFAATESERFDIRPTAEHREMVELKLKASKIKYEYMQWKTDNKDEFRRLYQEAERLLDLQDIPYKMAKESKAIQAGADIEELRNKRRKNYKLVYEQLKKSKSVCPLTPKLGDKDVPLYLAVMVEDRVALQAKLCDEDIYAPVLWPKAKNLPEICKDAEYLYAHALCLPIDQRYEEDDMERMAQCIVS